MLGLMLGLVLGLQGFSNTNMLVSVTQNAYIEFQTYATPNAKGFVFWWNIGPMHSPFLRYILLVLSTSVEGQHYTYKCNA